MGSLHNIWIIDTKDYITGSFAQISTGGGGFHLGRFYLVYKKGLDTCRLGSMIAGNLAVRAYIHIIKIRRDWFQQRSI